MLPLPWCALGAYAGNLRQLMLKLRQPHQGKALAALFQLLSEHCTLPVKERSLYFLIMSLGRFYFSLYRIYRKRERINLAMRMRVRDPND